MGKRIGSIDAGRVGNKIAAGTNWAYVLELDRYCRDSDFLFEEDLPLTISEYGLELDVLHFGTSSQISRPEDARIVFADAAIH